MRKRNKVSRYERYELARSPLAQKPTQRKLAKLLGLTRDDLRRLADYHDHFIVRRQEKIGEKMRDLAYPVAALRKVHEQLKFHLNKIKQPSYLFSPRKGKGQRDNAHLHIDQDQYLTLDLTQFYPSTPKSKVRKWLTGKLGMYDDVAGLITKLATVDGKVSFGSPLTPVLCTMLYRDMFNEIAYLCSERGLNFSVWVDDLTISGKFVPGELLDDIRSIVRRNGLGSHKIQYRTGNRPVFLTGIGVVGRMLVAPNKLHLRIKSLWKNLHDSATNEERADVVQQLLSQLGTLKHIVGRKSVAGMKAADQMNSLRQKRDRWRKEILMSHQKSRSKEVVYSKDIAVPW